MLKQIDYQALLNILERNPNLTSNGINSYEYYTAPFRATSFTQAEKSILEGRKQLLHGLAECQICINFLSALDTYTKRKCIPSYRLKNIIEKISGKYISNGTLIAAVIFLGLEIEHGSKRDPNVYIKLPASLDRVFGGSND